MIHEAGRKDSGKSPSPLRVLLLFATTGYQAQAFLDAARRLGVETLLGTDRCHLLKDPWHDGAIPLRFEDPEASAQVIVDHARAEAIHAIVPVGDRPTLVAALACQALGIPHNPPTAADACRNKFLSRQLFRSAGLRVPRFACYPLDARPQDLLSHVPFPCVLKPLALSGSRGVIRADDPGQFVPAFRRIRALLQGPDIPAMKDERNRQILVEGFIEGGEVALDGILDGGRLNVLALFDKPDPLNGPFFEETLYITPSRLDEEAQGRIFECAEEAARALGLLHGPIHAEVRINSEGPWVLEVAARSIGGLCSRALRIGSGVSLEELILRHALRMEIPRTYPSEGASGVMMIPIPKGGVYQRTEGLREALKVAGIEEIAITAKPHQELVPLPEGSSYLGFIFARGSSPERVEEALRKAHERLHFIITPNLPLA